MLHDGPQHGRRGDAAERADECPVVLAGMTAPPAVAGDNACRVIEQMRCLGKHENSCQALPNLSLQKSGERLADSYPFACRGVDSCAAGFTGTFQISSAYSRMVRSEENHGIRATLRMLARVQAGTTCQRASMPRWAS